MQQKTTKTDSLVPCIEVMQGWITGWNVIWIGRGERVNTPHNALEIISLLSELVRSNRQDTVSGCVCDVCSCLIQENKDPEAVRRRAMQNPEIQQIIADPAMQLILQQMQKDPQALREYVPSCLSVCLQV